MSDYPFIARINDTCRSGVRTSLFGCSIAGATWNCCRFGASFVYTIQPCTTLQCHFIQSHIGRVYVRLAVTCHLHFWQNDRAAAVTRGWNGYRKIRVSTEIWPWRRKFSRHSSGESNTGSFDRESDALTTELSPLLGTFDTGWRLTLGDVWHWVTNGNGWQMTLLGY